MSQPGERKSSFAASFRKLFGRKSDARRKESGQIGQTRQAAVPVPGGSRHRGTSREETPVGRLQSGSQARASSISSDAPRDRSLSMRSSDGLAQQNSARSPMGPVPLRQPPQLSSLQPMTDSPATHGSIPRNSRPQASGQWGDDSYNTPRLSGHGSQDYSQDQHRSPLQPSFSTHMGRAQETHMQTLADGVTTLARRVVKAGNRRAKEDAILKLYAVISQAAWVTQRGLTEEWAAIFFGILQAGLGRFVKHTASIVVRPDKGFTDLVRTMAASILKSLALWIEKELLNVTAPERLSAVIDALESIIAETHKAQQTHDDRVPGIGIYPRMIPEDGFAEEDPASILDTNALHGVLDDASWSQFQDARAAGNRILETGNLGSLMDTASLEQMLTNGQGARGGMASGSGRRVPGSGRRRDGAPSILDTQNMTSTGAFDTQDLTQTFLESKGALRALCWLFKADQRDGWHAAASLTGSIASLGLQEISALNGAQLIKPLVWLLRTGDSGGKVAAMRALMFLSDDALCRSVLAREDKHLRALVRTLASGPAEAQWAAATTLAVIVADDPSTHWVLTQAGIVAGMVAVLKHPTAPLGVKADVTLGLKHLTASSQRNRDALININQGLAYLIPLLQSDSAEAQYNTARILRHLALGSVPQQSSHVLPAIVPLVEALKMSRPRVCFACAAALAMLTEGHPEVCEDIQRHGGIQALVALLSTGGGQGKKSAAEALQALAAENESCKIDIAAAGAIEPLTAMVRDGNLQQQAAAAGALQALAYCPSRGPAFAHTIATLDGLGPLVDVLEKGPVPMCCAAAGALCNLALACPQNQVEIVEAGAVPLLVQLLSVAQPDGQYSAAATLFNLASYSANVRDIIIAADAIPALVPLLAAESWYCRIVAAEVLALLLAAAPLGGLAQAAEALDPLAALLTLQHRPGAIEESHPPVAHLAYERNEDVIVMKGYKFARAKGAAAAAIGCMAAVDERVAEYAIQEPAIVEQLVAMLQSRSGCACRTAAATLADLAMVSRESCEALIQEPVLPGLVSLLERAVSASAHHQSAWGEAGTGLGLLDAVAVAQALRVFAALDEAAGDQIVSLGAVQPLVQLCKSRRSITGLGSPIPAAQLLIQLIQVSAAASSAVATADAEDLIHNLADEGEAEGLPDSLSAEVLAGRLQTDYWGFAITAKPSANLYILLQLPFDTLVPLEPSAPETHPDLGSLAKSKELDRSTAGKSADVRSARVREFLDKRAAKENNPLPNGLAPMGPSAGSIDDGAAWAAAPEGASTPEVQRQILETWTEY
ncbi:hypothetical protein WJX73_006109 [Symbiochloris irregularis]|uniref:Uncharacterized protein n=1 Tax=Symbiochloris irregularis TaxID=706552 RepID=A0AAW1NTD7_9CHLO